jgi:hypothetical protein
MHTRTQQQLSAEEIRQRVGHLTGVHSMNERLRLLRSRDLTEAEVRVVRQHGQRDRNDGRDEFLHGHSQDDSYMQRLLSGGNVHFLAVATTPRLPVELPSPRPQFVPPPPSLPSPRSRRHEERAMAVDYAVIIIYLLGMLAVGWWGMRRA